MKIFVTDGEGPVTKNDNAYELSEHYIKGEDVDGASFFTVVSSYDDVLAYIIKRKNYKAGDTLKLILPFLKAYGANNQGIIKYSMSNVLLMPSAAQTLNYIHIKLRMPLYMISTSYEPYVKTACNLLNVPFKKLYCTELDIDRYSMPEKEKLLLIKLSKEISSLKPIEIPTEANSIKDLSERDQQTFEKLEDIFWNTLPKMVAYTLIQEVNPIGGVEKANAILDICKSTGRSVSELMYVGDSITDVEALNTIKRGRGLSISFNGNAYAIGEAEIAVLSHDTLPVAVLAEAFNRHGLSGAQMIAEDWSYETLEKNEINPKQVIKLSELKVQPMVYMLTQDNRDQVAAESSKFRQSVRGERVGALG